MVISGVFEALISLVVCFGLFLGVIHALLSAFGFKKAVPALIKAIQQGFGLAIGGFFGLVGTGLRELVLGAYYGLSGKTRPTPPPRSGAGGTGGGTTP